MARFTRWAAGFGIAAVGAGIAATTYGAIHAHSYRLRRRTLLLPVGTKMPSLRIVHISDAHALPRHTKRLDFIQGLADYEPDLVVVTGDMIASAAALEPILVALEPLLDIPGVFVFGSNDYVAPKLKNPFSYLFGPSNKGKQPAKEKLQELPWREFRDALSARGWLDLNNSRGTLHTGGWDLHFVGVADPHMGFDRMPAPANSAITEQPKMRIGLTHAPYTRVLNELVADGCELVFAGHTHGGQVCLPGGRALVSNCDLDPKYANGLFPWPLPARNAEVITDQVASSEHYPIKGDGAVVQENRNNSWVQVSAGIGAATYMPLRTFCPPEAVLLDVVPL